MQKKYDITGMTCASCQAHVANAVKKLDGTSNVNVNLLKNFMTCDVDETKCSDEIIIKAIESEGYGAKVFGATKNSQDTLKDNTLKKLIFAIVNLLILMYVSMLHMMFNAPLPYVFDMHKNPIGFSLIQFILTLPIIFIYSKYFINGYKLIFKGKPNMDSLIAIGSSFSLLYGIYSLFMISLGHTSYHKYLYFESSAMILVFVSIGKYLEGLSKKKTTKAIEHLMDLTPKEATIIVDGKEQIIDAKDVTLNDICIIKQGNIVPVDGIIIEGSASIDEANITGESIPRFKKLNDKVYASTILNNGYIKVKPLHVGSDTSIEEIIRLVDEASSSKAPISKLADKISGIFVPVIFAIALVVFLANFIYQKAANPFNDNAFEISLNFALTVVVIACPCALGLATPVAIMVGSGVAASNGLLIKNAEILENSSKIKTVVFDKTGTITDGKMSVTDTNISDPYLISVIKTLEMKSNHPLAKSICSYYKDVSELDDLTDFENVDGKGIVGVIDKKKYKIGNESFLNVKINTEKNFKEEGKTVLYVLENDNLIGYIALKDNIKPDSKEAIETLNKMGIKTVMLTGDNKETANSIAKEVNVSSVIAEVLPKDKQDVINSLKSNGNIVAMVGDGVNDALALSSADIGIAIGSGSNVALDSADIVLVRNSLFDVCNSISLSKRIMKTIKIGLFWAFFYNAICVFLASGIVYYLSNGSFKLEPMYGAIAMSLSSVSVCLNALTINLFKIKKNVNYEQDIKEEINMSNVVINVEGMMCKHCKAHVEEACMKVNGVVSANASLDDKNVTVEYTGNVDINEIKNNIIAAGYEAK